MKLANFFSARKKIESEMNETKTNQEKLNNKIRYGFDLTSWAVRENGIK